MAESHLSEAACLIEQGATYRKRVGLQPLQAQATRFSPVSNRLPSPSISATPPTYHFDLEGRWQRAFVDGTHFLKALDGTVQSIDRVREGPNLVLKRSTLDASAAAAISTRRSASMALALIGDLDAGNLGRIDPSSPKATPLPSDELREFLERIARWDTAAWLAHRERYFATYGPMPFLPPECLTAVVLQATLGHTGPFGSGRAHRPTRSTARPETFEQHAREVAALWGRRLFKAAPFSSPATTSCAAGTT